MVLGLQLLVIDSSYLLDAFIASNESRGVSILTILKSNITNFTKPCLGEKRSHHHTKASHCGTLPLNPLAMPHNATAYRIFACLRIAAMMPPELPKCTAHVERLTIRIIERHKDTI